MFELRVTFVSSPGKSQYSETSSIWRPIIRIFYYSDVPPPKRIINYTIFLLMSFYNFISFYYFSVEVERVQKSTRKWSSGIRKSSYFETFMTLMDLFFLVRGEILMDTPLLLIIDNSRVMSNSYRLKLHDAHPTRMIGVLQESLMNCLQLYPFPPSSCSSQF